MLIDAIDQRAIEVEEERRFDSHEHSTSATSAILAAAACQSACQAFRESLQPGSSLALRKGCGMRASHNPRQNLVHGAEVLRVGARAWTRCALSAGIRCDSLRRRCRPRSRCVQLLQVVTVEEDL